MSERTIDQTDAAAYVGTAMRGRLDDIAVLVRAADGAEDLSYGELAALDSLGVGDSPPAGEEACDLREEAEQSLHEWPLCVESTTTFEIVLGAGGPDDRVLIECNVVPNPGGRYRSIAYEIRRVLYRYSWNGSGEVELIGDDRDAAEAFARRVVPELAE